MIQRMNSTATISGLSSRVPDGTLPLASLYFLSSASMFFWAYMPRQMSALGWTGAQIGLFFAIKTISQAIATPAWAKMADNPEKSRPELLKWQYLIAAIAIGLLSVATSWTFGVVLAVLIGATVRCAPPLMDTMTLGTVGLNRFGRVRAFGTAGFGIVALGFGLLGIIFDHGILATGAPWLMFGLVAVAVPIIGMLPGARATADDGEPLRETERKSTGASPNIGSLLMSPVVLLVFPVAALFAATYVPYDLFLVQLAEERSFGAWLPGLAIFVGVIGELLGFLSFRSLVKRISPHLIASIVVAITGVRWILTGATTNPLFFVALQILHGLTFAAFFMAMLEIMTRHWGDDLGATPQGLLYLLVFTAGGGLGNLVSGILYDLGSAAALFQQAGTASFILLPGLVLALWFAHRIADRDADRWTQGTAGRFVRPPQPQVGVPLEAARQRYARISTSSSTFSRT